MRLRDEDHWAVQYWIAQNPDVVRRILRKEPLPGQDGLEDDAGGAEEMLFGMNDPYFLIAPPTLAQDGPIPLRGPSSGGGMRR